MQFSFKRERLLAVVAHPDDAELLCAGTLGRARDDGATIGICVLCQGDKGQPEPPLPNLAAVRGEEMAAAAELLGATLLLGKHADGTLADTPDHRSQLVELLRQFRPTLILAHAGNDYHPDHCAASELALAASWFAASRGHVTQSAALEQPPQLWWLDTVGMADFTPGFYIDVGDYVELKRSMLHCHRSQLARGDAADFAPLEEIMLRQCRARGLQSGVEAAEAFRHCQRWKRTLAW